MDNRKWFELARELTARLPPGSIFELNSLFSGTEWEGLPFGVRTYFGKYFSDRVKSGELPGISPIPFRRNNHRYYIKK